jgi:hypothetical protein
MADTFRIKRRAAGGAAGPPAALAAAELAFNEQDLTLYYGSGNSGGAATGIIPIAGSGAYLRLSGGTMSGPITLAADPTAALQPVTKQYADARAWQAAPNDVWTYGRHGASWVQVAPLTWIAAGAWDPNSIPTDGSFGFFSVTNQTGAPNWPADNPDQCAFLLHGYNSNAGWQNQLMMGGRERGGGPALWYRSTQDGGYSPWRRLFSVIGGTLTGPLILAADPSTALGAATKQYADAGDAARLPLAGGTMTGGITFASNTGSASNDFSHHLNLWGGQYGISITPNRLNIVSGNSIVLCLGNTDVATVAAGGITMAGTNTITLGADPTTALQAATKQYVDGRSPAPAQDSNVYGRQNTGFAPVFTYQSGGTVDFNAIPTGATSLRQYGGPITSSNGPPPYSITKGTVLQGYAANGGFSFQLLLTDTGNPADQGLWWRQMNGNNNWTTNAVWHRILTDQGGTMTGPLILAADPSTALGAATKQYVDNAITARIGHSQWDGVGLLAAEAAPDPLDEMRATIAALTARVATLEAALSGGAA